MPATIAVFIDFSKSLKNELNRSGYEMESLARDAEFEVVRKDIRFEGEPATRGVMLGVELAVGAFLILILQRGIIQIVDPAWKRILNPVLKKLKLAEESQPTRYIQVLEAVGQDENGAVILEEIPLQEGRNEIVLKRNTVIRFIEGE